MSERDELLERYRDGARAFRAAVEALGEDQLDRRPGTGEWTPREIVHHLADAEMRSAIRLRQLIAEADPVIQGYDEEAYARALYYDRPITSSLAAVEASRATSAELLDLLTEEQWGRAGTHTDSGRYSVEDWLRIYAAHAHDHAEQLAGAAG